MSLQKENDDLRKAQAIQPGFSPAEIASVGGENEGGGMRLSEDLLFGEGSASLKTSAHRPLDQVIAIIQEKYPQEKVIIEGHTDNQPLLKTRERWKSNMRLGYERAQAVFDYFIAHGIPEERIAIQDFSFNKPTDSRHRGHHRRKDPQPPRGRPQGRTGVLSRRSDEPLRPSVVRTGRAEGLAAGPVTVLPGGRLRPDGPRRPRAEAG